MPTPIVKFSLGRIALALAMVISIFVVIPNAPAGAVGGTNDDFDSDTLNAALWTPTGISGTAFSDTGAQAAILAPSGFTSYDPWTTGNNAPTLVQTISDGDLDVVAAFSTVPTQQFQIQGIIVANAADSAFIRFDIFSDGTNLRAFAAEPLVSAVPLVDAVAPAGSRFVRVEYDDSTGDWTLYTSTTPNPAMWTEAGTFNRPMNVGRIGPFGGTSFPSFGEPTPGFVAFVDYFGALPVPAGTGTDTLSPVNSARVVEKTTTTMKITWTTSEPTISTLRVNGGAPTTSVTDTPTFGLNHEVNLTGLSAGTAFNLQFDSTDVNGLTDTDSEIQSTPATDDAPVITFWYGDTQSVGGNATAQRWYNLLGNAVDPDGLAEIRYSLNGAADVNATIGPDGFGRRLENLGDFNVDLLVTDLQVGVNTIEVTARDTNGLESTRTATVNRIAGVTAPPAIGIDWTNVSALGSATAPVDGNWAVATDRLNTTQPGYDRILAVGDISWSDYDVLVPFSVSSLKSDKDVAPSFGSGVGVFLRWNGHNDTVVPGGQPKMGFWPDGVDMTPLGAIAWWGAGVGVDPSDPGSGQLEILDVTDPDGIGVGADPAVITGGTAPITLAFGTNYMLRAQADGSTYRLKVWAGVDVSNEPGGWQIEYDGVADANDPGSGSVALVAHEAVASFGDIVITPLSPAAGADATSNPVLSPVSGSIVGESATIMASGANGATIYYTTDGSTPTPLSTVFSAGVPVAPNMRFISYALGKDPSSVVTATYTVNAAPTVNAGADLAVEFGSPANLAGSVTDDGATGSLSIAWSKVDGPGDVVFADSAAATTTATFSQAGIYRLLLMADDSQEIRTDEITIAVGGGGGGYWLANAAGRVANFGSLDHFGDLSGTALTSPVGGIATNPNRTGYWLAQENGAVTPMGTITDFADLPDLGVVPAFPIVDIAATSTGEGAYLLGSDGGIFNLGDATFFGSTGAIALDQPVVAMANHATGDGYWFAALDGGIFTFGPDAKFLGSVPQFVPFDQLRGTIVGMAVTPTGAGYWLVAEDGGLFAFGDAEFFGSIPGVLPPGATLDQPIVGIVATPTGLGYWLVAQDGGVFAFGDAAFFGSDPTLGQVVGLAG